MRSTKNSVSKDVNGNADEEKIEHMDDSTLDAYGDVEHDDDPDTGLAYDDPLPADDKPYLEPERVAQFAERFHAGWKKTAEGYMEAAQALLDAKAELGHSGDFGKMVKRELGLKPKSAMRTAQMLMKIADNPVTKAKKFSPLLPRNWTTAHKLTELPNDVLEKLFTDGTITSDILGYEADALVEQHREQDRQEGHLADQALLDKLAEKWPDPTPLAEGMKDQTAEWVAKLAACVQAKAKAEPVQHKAKKRNGHHSAADRATVGGSQ